MVLLLPVALMATHKETEAVSEGERGREKVKGWERRAHAWACCSPQDQVEGTGR